MMHCNANDMYETMKGLNINAGNKPDDIAKQTKHFRADVVNHAVSTMLLHCKENMLKGLDCVLIDLDNIPLYINLKSGDFTLNGQDLFRDEIIDEAIISVMRLGYTLTMKNGVLRISWAEVGNDKNRKIDR